MKKKLILAVLMVVFLAVPAFASVQNVKVSGFVDSMYLYRDRFDLRQTGTAALDADNAGSYEQSLFITWTGLRVDADLTDKVKATIQLLNERPWGTDGFNGVITNSEVEVNLANVQLGDILDSNVSATIGRQRFNYGNAFIIGANGLNNSTSTGSALTSVAMDLSKRKAYDGVKFVVDYNPLVVDLFGAKISSNNNAGAAAAIDDDIDLYGVNFNYQLGDAWNSVLESYFFARIDQSVKTSGAAGREGMKADSVYVPGLRASTNPIKGLNVQGEVAWQKGNKALGSTFGTDGQNEARDAMSAQVIANYQVPFAKTAKYNPVVTGVYTYVSGDTNPAILEDNTLPRGPEKWTAWDPMMEDQSGGKIYNSLFNLTNSHILETSAQINPMEDVTVKLTWTGIWLDNAFYTVTGGSRLGNGTAGAGVLVQPDGSGGAWNPTITSNKGLGYEIDADLGYDYTEDVRIGLNFGWFFPGPAFDTTYNGNAKQAMATVDVAF